MGSIFDMLNENLGNMQMPSSNMNSNLMEANQQQVANGNNAVNQQANGMAMQLQPYQVANDPGSPTQGNMLSGLSKIKTGSSEGMSGSQASNDWVNTDPNAQSLSSPDAYNAEGAAMSDEDVKTNTSDGQKEVGNFMDKVEPYNYQYKNPIHQGGEHASGNNFTGIMAQDLMKSKAGASAVFETSEGLAVDNGRLSHLAAAATGLLHRRLSVLEDAVKNMKRK